MDRLTYFFRQRVTSSELNLGFTNSEEADKSIAVDNGLVGVLSGIAVTAQSSPNATVQVGQGVVYDPDGLRINIPSTQTVNTAVDFNAVTTAVATPGNQKYVSVFILFDRADSDPRVDGNSQTVYFVNAGTFFFKVVQGTEAPTGTALPPSLDADAILLADILLSFGSTTVTNGIISTTRRQDAFVAAGSPRAIRRGKALDAIADLNTNYNNHVTGAADLHPATNVNYSGGPAWLDGTTNPATGVEFQLDKIVTDLSAPAGAAKVGTQDAGTFRDGRSIDAGSVSSQIVGLVNILRDVSAGASLVYPPMGTIPGSYGSNASYNNFAQVITSRGTYLDQGAAGTELISPKIAGIFTLTPTGAFTEVNTVGTVSDFQSADIYVTSGDQVFLWVEVQGVTLDNTSSVLFWPEIRNPSNINIVGASRFNSGIDTAAPVGDGGGNLSQACAFRAVTISLVTNAPHTFGVAYEITNTSSTAQIYVVQCLAVVVRNTSN